MGTVTSASAVVLTGAWHAFAGIFWGVCKWTGLAVIGTWFGLFVWAYFFGSRKPGGPLPVRKPQVGDDTLAMLAQRREVRPRHGCDEDTFIGDGMTEALDRMLRGEGRG
jgi:hypothetical protein